MYYPGRSLIFSLRTLYIASAVKMDKTLMKGRKEKIDYLAIILLKAITAVQRAGFDRPSEKNVRDLARNMEHSNVNHKACFAGSERKKRMFVIWQETWNIPV